MSRRKLPNRRRGVTFDFAVGPHKFIGTVGLFEDNSPAELFINTEQKAGSEADTNASDGAIAISLALQWGCPLDVLREAMKRTPEGAPQGPLGAALDKMKEVTE